jgi:cell division protein FtsI/penicillin-binding protein 2
MKRTQHIATRAWVLFALFAVFGVAILLRIILIQLDPSHMDISAMLPQVRTIEPERGRILSADGHLLAASVPRSTSTGTPQSSTPTRRRPCS